MIKMGSLRIDDEFDKYIVYERTPLFIRLDVYISPSDFSPINSGKAVCSYILDKKEKWFGDVDLAKKILSAITIIDGLPSTNKNITKEDGIINLTIEKDIGDDYYKYESVNKLVRYECYVHDDLAIEFTSFTQGKTYKGIDLLNEGLYTVNKLKNSINDDVYEDIHTLEYLKADNPDISKIEQRDYVVVQSEEEFWERLNAFKNEQSEIKGLDTETSGINVSYMGNDYLTGVILSEKENRSTYFPFRQKRFKYNLPIERLIDIFNALRDLPKDQKVIAWYSTMEIKSIMKEMMVLLKERQEKVYLHECIPRVDIDGYILSVLKNPSFVGVSHSLKSESQLTDKIRYIELEDIFKSKKLINFSGVPLDITRVYACPDGDNPIKCYKRLFPQLPVDERNLLMLESRNMVNKAVNEFYGLNTDYEKLVSMFENVKREVLELEDKFKSIHKISGNIRSPLVLRDIIYGKLNCPVSVVTSSTGLPAVNKVAIATILKSGKLETDEEFEPFIDSTGNQLISARDMKNKYPSLVILQTYNLKFKEYTQLKRLIEHSSGGRVSFRINPVGAASGRQTSDAHQFSDPMKANIIADTPYHWLYDSDLKQVELRILIALARDSVLKEYAEDPETDLHRAFASRILGKEMWEISAKERGDLKPVNFGVVYGKTEYGLAVDEYGPNYTREQLNSCRDKITSFFTGLPLINRLLNSWIEFIEKNGYVKTEFGRYRYDYSILSPNCTKAEKRKIIRQLKNTPIQGFGADVLKIIECRMWEHIKSKGWDELVQYDDHTYFPKVRMMIPVHDEILFSADKTIPVEEILEMCKSSFEVSIPHCPTLYAEPSLATNWLDAHDGDIYGIPIKLRNHIIDQYNKDKIPRLTLDNWVDTINDYKHQLLKDYMDSLISKYKTEEEIVKNVRHPNLTHVLISSSVDSKTIKSLTQREAIKVAVHNYLNSEVSTQEIIETNADLYDNNAIDIELNDNMEDITNYEENRVQEDLLESNTFTGSAEKIIILRDDIVISALSYNTPEKLIEEKLDTLDLTQGDYNLLFMKKNGELIEKGKCNKQYIEKFMEEVY